MFKPMLVVVLAVALCGCRKDEEKITTPEGEVTFRNEDEQITVKTKDGTAVIDAESGQARITTKDGTFSVGNVEVPEGFPLPIMSDARMQHAMHQQPRDGQEVFSAGFKTSASVDEATGFYRQALADKQFEVEDMEISSPDGKSMTLSGASQGADAIVNIFREGSDTVVTLTWTTKQ